jgi:GT2 family glycosyltransferase
MLLRRAALDQVGHLDESMHYAEDMDLCLRLRRAGWRIHYLAAASIVHYGGRSSERAGNEPLRYQIAFQSFWYFLYKHQGRFAAFRLSCVMAAWSVGVLLAAAAARSARTLGLRAARPTSPLGAVGRAMLRWSLCDKGRFRHHLARPLVLDPTRPRQ